MHFHTSLLVTGLFGCLALSQVIAIDDIDGCVFFAGTSPDDTVEGCYGSSDVFGTVDGSACNGPYGTELGLCGTQTNGIPVARISLDSVDVVMNMTYDGPYNGPYVVTYYDQINDTPGVYCTIDALTIGASCTATSTFTPAPTPTP